MASPNEITLNTEKTNFERRYDIDWLRIIAVLLVFIYHCSRFFDEREWHVKNSELDLGMTSY